jgi:hypothetical protein
MDRRNDDKIVFETSEDVKIVSTFDDMNLKEDLMRGIYAYSNFIIIFYLNLLILYFLRL